MRRRMLDRLNVFRIHQADVMIGVIDSLIRRGMTIRISKRMPPSVLTVIRNRRLFARHRKIPLTVDQSQPKLGNRVAAQQSIGTTDPNHATIPTGFSTDDASRYRRTRCDAR